MASSIIAMNSKASCSTSATSAGSRNPPASRASSSSRSMYRVHAPLILAISSRTGPGRESNSAEAEWKKQPPGKTRLPE